jgi:hypothetical protein
MAGTYWRCSFQNGRQCSDLLAPGHRSLQKHSFSVTNRVYRRSNLTMQMTGVGELTAVDTLRGSKMLLSLQNSYENILLPIMQMTT